MYYIIIIYITYITGHDGIEGKTTGNDIAKS